MSAGNDLNRFPVGFPVGFQIEFARASTTGPSIVTDATSGKGVPLTQTEWDAVFDAAGVARKTLSSSWGFQDAGLPIVASVGTNLTVTGTLGYQTAVTGWTRLAVSFTDTAAERAAHALGVGIDPSATSCLWFGLIDCTSIVGTRAVMTGGGAVAASILTLRSSVTSGVIGIKVMTIAAAGASDQVAGGVRPFVLLYDRTGTRAVVYNDLEKKAGTYAAGVTDGIKGFGANAESSPQPMDVLLGACFAGVNAEWSDADVKVVLQAMNWTIPWS